MTTPIHRALEALLTTTYGVEPFRADNDTVGWAAVRYRWGSDEPSLTREVASHFVGERAKARAEELCQRLNVAKAA
jgi:hypothetical protein